MIDTQHQIVKISFPPGHNTLILTIAAAFSFDQSIVFAFKSWQEEN